jgi:hypothetical protein
MIAIFVRVCLSGVIEEFKKVYQERFEGFYNF